MDFKHIKNKLSKVVKSDSLRLRVISASVLLPLILILIISGGQLFAFSLGVIATIMAFEWEGMVRNKSFEPIEVYKWRLIGFIYIMLPIASLLYIRNTDHGLLYFIWMTFIVVATDTGAYFTGLTFNGPKLAPHISPKKNLVWLYWRYYMRDYHRDIFRLPLHWA
jgi:phosphatidate cytidylyltransferase